MISRDKAVSDNVQESGKWRMQPDRTLGVRKAFLEDAEGETKLKLGPDASGLPKGLSRIFMHPEKLRVRVSLPLGKKRI